MDDASDKRETTEICGVRENTRSELLNQSEESEQSDCENTNLGQRVSTRVGCMRIASGRPFQQPHCAHNQLSAIEYVGTHSHYVWEGKCRPVLLPESLWEGGGIDLAVANSRHFYRIVISCW
jgi:hypothetical protein